MVRTYLCSPAIFELSDALRDVSSSGRFAGYSEVEDLHEILEKDETARAVIVYEAPEIFADYTDRKELRASLSRWLSEIDGVLRLARQYSRRITLVMRPDLSYVLGQLGLHANDIDAATVSQGGRNMVIGCMIHRILSCLEGAGDLLTELEARSYEAPFQTAETPNVLADEVLTLLDMFDGNVRSDRVTDLLQDRMVALRSEVDSLRGKIIASNDAVRQISILQNSAMELRSRLERAERSGELLKRDKNNAILEITKLQNSVMELEDRLKKVDRSGELLKSAKTEDARRWDQAKRELNAKINGLQNQLKERDQQLQRANAEIERILNSKSFRMTSIFRRARYILVDSWHQNE